MDSDILERLLIDRSLGELSADVSELLEAYLESHPECAQSAHDTDTTIAEARRALQAASMASDETMPSLRPTLSIRLPRRARSHRAWFQNIAVAAAVMIGFFLGSWHTSNPALSQSEKTTRIAEAVVNEPTPTEQDNFWSLSRLRDTQEHSPSTNKPRLKWANPIGTPRIGEQS